MSSPTVGNACWFSWVISRCTDHLLCLYSNTKVVLCKQQISKKVMTSKTGSHMCFLHQLHWIQKSVYTALYFKVVFICLCHWSKVFSYCFLWQRFHAVFISSAKEVMLSGLFICLSACQQDYTKLGVMMGHFSVDLEKRMDHGIFFIITGQGIFDVFINFP